MEVKLTPHYRTHMYPNDEDTLVYVSESYGDNLQLHHSFLVEFSMLQSESSFSHVTHVTKYIDVHEDHFGTT